MASRLLARVFDYLVYVEVDHGVNLREPRRVYASGSMNRRTAVRMSWKRVVGRSATLTLLHSVAVVRPRGLGVVFTLRKR